MPLRRLRGLAGAAARGAGLVPLTVPRRPDAAPDLPRASELARGGCWLEPRDAEVLERLLARDAAPLPSLAAREGYFGERHFDYWVSGLNDALAALDAYRRATDGEPNAIRTLDLGGASGRVARHVPHLVPGSRAIVADLSADHVDWVNGRLAGSGVVALQNTVVPSLPLADASLDLITAYSVFTHLEDFETAWLFELARCLRPGGVAYLTVHTDHTWTHLDPSWALHEMLTRPGIALDGEPFDSGLLQGALPAERCVLTWKDYGAYRSNVFHSERHLRDVWGSILDVVELIHEGSDYQDVVVLRKPT